MDMQLTRSERYRIMQIGPKVEALVVPLILEAAIEDTTALRPYYQKNTKTVSFFLSSRIRDKQSKQEQCFREHIGLIRRAKAIQPNIIQLRVTAEAFSTEMVRKQPCGYPYPIPCQELTRLPMTWYGNLVSLVNKDELHIRVAPPADDADSAQHRIWQEWLRIYTKYAKEVSFFSYWEGCTPPLFSS